MSVSPVALILGAGRRVGLSVGAMLKSKGYKVALASRNPAEDLTEKGYYPVKVDLGDPSSLANVFANCERNLGQPASVVVYNAAAMTVPHNNDPLSGLSINDFEKALNVGTLSVWSAAQATMQGWKKLPDSIPTTFIYTGNLLPWAPVPRWVTLGVQKAASAHLIETLAIQYGEKGYRFYFADQVSSTGGIPGSGEFGGAPAAMAYWDLIQQKEQGNWDYRFTADGKALQL